MHRVEEHSTLSHRGDDEESLLEDSHHGSVSNIDLTLGQQAAIVVTHNHVCSLTRDVNVLSFPKELSWREPKWIPLGPWHLGIFLILPIASNEVVSLQEEEHIMSRTKTDLISLRDLPRHIIATTLIESIDFHVEAEHQDLLALVLLDHFEILLLEEHDLLVKQQSEVIQSREVLDLVDLCMPFELGLS